MTDTRFAGLPPRTEVANLTILSLAFALCFGVLYCGASVLSAYVPWRVSVALPIDSQFPFWPAAAAIYLTITPLLQFAPFVLRDFESFLPLVAALILATIIAAVCFILLPIDGPVIECCEGGIAGVLFRTADWLNLELNYLPSLHVTFAFILACALAPRASRAGGIALYAWACAVAASTLVTRQHYLLDLVAGIVLAFFCWRVARNWARRPAVLAAVDVELLCLRNFGLFTRRHGRYFAISVAVLAAGIPHWRRQRLVRTGFAFLQAVDDVLDGDRASEREPLEVADELAAALDNGAFAADDLARVGAAFRADLLARGGRAALDIAIALVRCMQRDRRRVLERKISSRDELVEIHRATFRGSLDLLLLAADSPLRAADVPDLVDALGWCSTVRDLDEDLAHGLINIPADVFAASPETNAVRDWLAAERERARGLLARVDARLDELQGQRGAKLLRRFARSMRRYARG